MPTPKSNESKQDFLVRCTRELVGGGQKPEKAYAMCNRDWDRGESQRCVERFAVPVSLDRGEDAEGEENFFLITAYTGAIVEKWWGGLAFDVKGMHAKEKFPVLREHMRDRVVGHSTKSWRDKDNFLVRGEFSSATLDGAEVKALAAEGFPWQASVSVWPEEIVILETDKEEMKVNGRTIKGPAEIWTKSFVGEVSFVALGADSDTAAIGFSGAAERVPVTISYVENSNPGGKVMELTDEFRAQLEALVKEPDAGAVLAEFGLVPKPEGNPPEIDKITGDAKEEGRKAAMEKAAKLVSLCRLAAMPVEFAEGLIKDDVSVEDAGKKILEAKAKGDGEGEIRSTLSGLSTGEKNQVVEDAKKRAEAAKTGGGENNV